MLTDCCGNHFCSVCIEEENGSLNFNCPECNQNDVKAIFNRKKWAKILKLQVKCSNYRSGCSWTGELGNGVDHLNPTTGDCNYIDIECTKRCGETVVKMNLADHLKYDCPKRPATCPYCKTVGEYAIINGEHQNKCPASVPCPNKCGEKGIRQATLKQHLSECPEEAVECDFHYAGCTNLVLRKHLTVHLQKNLEKHLNIQTESFLAEIEKKDEQLQQLVMEQEEQLQQLSAYHRQQIEEKDKIIEGLLKKEIREMVEEKLGEGVESLKARYSELEMNVNRLDKLSARLEREKLRYICLLHEGKHSTEIWKGKYNDKKVVIKKPTAGASSASILQEIDVLLRLRHKNIVEVYGTLTHSEPVCIVMEYLPNGTLQDYLRSNHTLLLHEEVLVCKQVALGLEYLQQKLCIHRKVGASNILLGEKLHCKLSDFSLSKFIDNHQECIPTQKDHQYQIKWCAPEVIKETGFFSKI